MANAMSVDVEEYFQVSAFAGTVERQAWDHLDSRVEASIARILDLFAARDVHGTFFTLGWIAERHPAMIRRIAAAGHEIASHGFEHVRVHAQTPEAFRADVRRTKRILEDLAGAPVRGYRAASFSVTEATAWAFEALAEEGYAYSSSVYPIRHDHYGIPGAPRFAYRPLPANPFLEVPISTVRVLGHNLPCGGGGYFRLLPYGLSRWAMRRVNAGDGRPCIFYFHPWEIDPGQPRFAGTAAKTRFRHYTNLGRMERRLRALLTEFAWDRIDRIFLDGDTRER